MYWQGAEGDWGGTGIDWGGTGELEETGMGLGAYWEGVRGNWEKGSHTGKQLGWTGEQLG